MDLINNLIFTSINDVGGFPPLKPAFFTLPPIFGDAITKPLPQPRTGGFFAYDPDVVENFLSFDDADFIDDAIQKHWADVVVGRSYISQVPAPIDPPNDPDTNVYFSRFRAVPPTGEKLEKGNLIPPYHMIYAYLVENTRIAQIFEKLLYLYMHDEKLKKATTPENRLAFQWMINTENLFFKHLPNSSYRNITSQVRTFTDLTRRNAYYRMFGMDLAFGDMNSNAPVNYFKAESNNQPFIILFEKFLAELWQAYTNAKNEVGQNNTDMVTIVDAAQKIQELLMSRRTTETNFNNYRYFNLSREEFSSVVMMSWFYEVVAYDSPMVRYLNCNGGTPGERLVNIGNKVGVNAHSKSEGLLDIAPPMNTLLRRVEFGDYNNESTVTDIIKSQANNLPLNSPERLALNDLLQIINNWEKATGHRIKNPEANIRGTVRIQTQQANGAGANGTGVKPQAVAN